MKTNKLVLKTNMSAADVLAAINEARKSGYTHAQSDAAGAKQAVPLADLESLVGVDQQFILGVRRPGLPFEDRPLTDDEVKADEAKANGSTSKASPKSAPKSKKAPKAKREAKKAPEKKEPTDTGYVAFITHLLMNTTEGKVEGFVRSKYTVQEALKMTLAKFPDKNPESVKKIIKVRPRHLERAKGTDYNKTNRAPRWAYVGPGAGLSIKRIDELIEQGLRTKEIAEQLHRERGQPVDHFLTMAQKRRELRK